MRKTAQVRSRRSSLPLVKRKSGSKGFTLVELLVVIAIVAILAAVVVIVINPLELTKRGRDATRLSDLANLQQAINVAVQEAAPPAAGTSLYCNSGAVPAGGCVGNSTDNAAAPATFKTDGTGWVKVNISGQTAVQVSTLPRDPTNDATYHYTYHSNATGTGYEIDTTLESQQQSPKEISDGGNNDGLYEVGSDLTSTN